jgi:hypothetical protein
MKALFLAALIIACANALTNNNNTNNTNNSSAFAIPTALLGNWVDSSTGCPACISRVTVAEVGSSGLKMTAALAGMCVSLLTEGMNGSSISTETNGTVTLSGSTLSYEMSDVEFNNTAMPPNTTLNLTNFFNMGADNTDETDETDSSPQPTISNVGGQMTINIATPICNFSFTKAASIMKVATTIVAVIAAAFMLI